ncbi:MAG TPA: crossover junction endodeoxyribonuclease RuvC [Candidatus Paceibacterota bacterium]|nr:crossover junction endodeoxyribonuclease RuvC [Candidatus Paceibacterota bacterium]HRZ34224.1 crossover junction endodeoxyribonuclease RuvC [Candidatus Paceibacterota bacterium]
MKIIAVDPGYERLGIAILDAEKPEKESLVFSECFRTSAKESHPERLAKIQNEIGNLINKFKPKELAIESLFFNSNQKTALKVAETRGTIISLAKNSELEVFEYSPQEIKIAITGNGRSDKSSVAKMLSLILKLGPEIKYDDEFDAIACGVTHLSSLKTRGR